MITEHGTSQKTQPIEQVLNSSLRDLPDLLAPGQVAIAKEFIRLGDRFYIHLYISNLPRRVTARWLESLFNLNIPHDVDLLVESQETRQVISRLQKQRRDLVSTRLQDQAKGRLTRPEVELAMDDLSAIMSKVEAGLDKVFKLDILITTWGATPGEARERALQLANTAARCAVDTRQLTFRQERGFRSLLPGGLNLIRMPKVVDGTTLALAFPFASTDLNMPGGVLLGTHAIERSPVIVNLWRKPDMANSNLFACGKPGAGKSFFIKLLIARHLTSGIKVVVVDPENEYSKLAEAAGGKNLKLSTSNSIFNPFQLPANARGQIESGIGEEKESTNPLTEKVSTLIPLLSMMISGATLGDSRGDKELTQEAKNILEKAVFEAYRRCGITRDEIWSGRLTAQAIEQNTQAFADRLSLNGVTENTRQLTTAFGAPRLPTLVDVRDSLEDLDRDNFGLVYGLERYISGAFAGFFSTRPTDLAITDHLTVLKIREVSKELQPLVVLLTMDWVWGVAVRYRQRMQFVVDELWNIISSVAGGDMVEQFARLSRKRGLSLVVATQQVEDLLQSRQGRAVLSCCDTKWIGQQEAHQKQVLAESLSLNEDQLKFVLYTARQGLSLLKCGTRWLPLSVVHSPEEYRFAETNPPSTNPFSNGR